MTFSIQDAHSDEICRCSTEKQRLEFIIDEYRQAIIRNTTKVLMDGGKSYHSALLQAENDADFNLIKLKEIAEEKYPL